MAGGKGVSPEYDFCMRFRRWAKRALALRKDGDLDSDELRTKLIEEMWDFGGELYVWGTADRLNRVIRHLYEGENQEAGTILNSLADDELENLRQTESGEEAPGEPE